MSSRSASSRDTAARDRRERRLRLMATLVLGAAACTTRPIAPDLVLTNAKVVTLDSAARGFTSIAIGGGRIVGLANAIDPAWLAANPVVMDLGGAVIAPAFTDHHVHLFNAGMALLNRRDRCRLAIELSAVRSLRTVDSLVRARAAALPKGAWIFGNGWSQATWGSSALPTAGDLGGAAPNNPVFLARTDGVIARGGPADLVAWSADPFSVPRGDLATVRTRVVVNAGHVVVSGNGKP